MPSRNTIVSRLGDLARSGEAQALGRGIYVATVKPPATGEAVVANPFLQGATIPDAGAAETDQGQGRSREGEVTPDVESVAT